MRRNEAHSRGPRAAKNYALLATLALAVPVASCGGGGTTNMGDGGNRNDGGAVSWVGLRELVIDPPMVTLQGSPRMSTTQQFNVTAVYMDGRRTNVTRAVNYALEPSDVGSVRDGLFTTSMISGGEARLFARAGTISTAARITVRWSASMTGEMVPADVATRFSGATEDASAAPRVVYPYDNTLLPPNISNLEVHWTPPAGAGEYHDIAFTNAITDVHLYTRCAMANGGCTAALPRGIWQWISTTNRGGASPLEVRARSLVGTDRVGTSAPVNIRFAPDDIEGGIYYWTAAGDTNGIYRYDFTMGDRAPQAFYTQPDTPRNHLGEEHSCTGCHTLSQDGRRMATVLGGGHVGDVLMLDVASRRVTASKIEEWAQLLSFNPAGDRLVASRNGAMRVLNADTLDATGDLDTGGIGTHPEWSPANNGIVFTRPVSQRNSIWVQRGSIAWLPSMGGTMFGAAQVLAPGVMGENRYYPSVTPDGRFVVFNRSVCPGGDEASGDCDAYDDPTAELRIVDTELAMHREVALTNANAQGPTDTRAALTNSWPRVSPFTSQVSGRRVYWVTFSSRRNYGVRLVNNDHPQLWMVAVAVPDGEVQMPLESDPSFAPFWLPFQDMNTGNHIAQWTRSIVAIGAPGLPPGVEPPGDYR